MLNIHYICVRMYIHGHNILVDNLLPYLCAVNDKQNKKNKIVNKKEIYHICEILEKTNLKVLLIIVKKYKYANINIKKKFPHLLTFPL